MGLDPAITELFQRALVDHRAGRLLQAQAAYREILTIDAAHAEAHYALGNALYALGRPGEAVASFREALQLRPDYPEAHNNLGSALCVLDRPEEAVASFREALQLRRNNPEAHNNLGNALYALGRPGEAEVSFREALQLRPDNPEAHNNLGNTLYALGRPTEAEASFREALQLQPDYPEAHNNLGSALCALGRPAEAEVSFREALQLRPNDPEAHSNLGNALYALGRLANAEASFREALRLWPDYPEAHNNLGSALCALGRPAEAEASFREALRLRPNNAEAHNNLGNALYALGRLANAEASFREALQLRPDNPEAHNNLGNALCALGRPAEAEASFREALQLRPNNAEAHNNLGNALHALGRAAQAEASFREALRLRPDSPEAHNNLGNALCALGRPAEAEASFREALRLRPDYPEAHSNLGNALCAHGRPAEAVASFREALQLRPDYPQAHHNLGNALHALNRWRESIDCFERVLSLKPDDPATRLALCMVELPMLYADEAEIAERRASYAARLESLTEQVADTPHAVALADGIGALQPFFLPYQGRNDRDLQAIYGALACRVMAARYAPVALPPPPAPDERVRVGIVSGFFRQHQNWRIPIQGWLGQLDSSRFDLFGYHVGAVCDAETERAASLCDRFVQGPMSIERWRQEIAADAPHVLIYPEVGMNPISAKLAAQRLAPVQCNSWGHPETSGFPTLDYFLSSDLMEPSDAQQYYCEKLIRLPNLSVYCEPIEPSMLASERAEFGMRPSACIYWCPLALFKYLPQHDSVFPRIAREAGDCQFVFIMPRPLLRSPITGFDPGVNDLFRLRLERAFGQFGLRAEDHCLILPSLEPERYLAATGLSDVFLDSIGWSGCNTTLDALAYDLPIVTLRGDLMRGSHSAAMLDMMGMSATVCDSIEEYVELAVRLARDHAWRAEVKRTIAGGKHAIYRDRICIAALEEFLDQVARSERGPMQA